MTKQPRLEQCANCPDRGRISRLLASLVGKEQLAEGCEGKIAVSRGQIVTQIRTGNQPTPPKETWNIEISSIRLGGERRYSRTDWTTETVCGRETIESGTGEVAYAPGELIRTNSDGMRVAAFIRGGEQDIADHRGTLAIVGLLDAVSDLQKAQSTGDAVGEVRAHDAIADQGFSLGAVAGRHDV